MKALRYIPIIALLTLAGCQKDKLPKGTPSCIETRVQQMKDQALQTPPMRVVEYEYNQATVYYIPASGACCPYSVGSPGPSRCPASARWLNWRIAVS